MIDGMRLSSGAISGELKSEDNHQSIPIKRLLRLHQTRHRRPRPILLGKPSRDQSEKVYVQHFMREASKELFAWMEEGAHFFVCGDGARMARDVDAELHAIVSRERNEFERSSVRDCSILGIYEQRPR